jgi:hypothetical protein
MKFFFNEDDVSKRKTLLLRREKRQTLNEISSNIAELLKKFYSMTHREAPPLEDQLLSDEESADSTPGENKNGVLTDRMLMTPFGRQYGSKIDLTIEELFNPENASSDDEDSEKYIRENVAQLYKLFKNDTPLVRLESAAVDVVQYLIFQQYGMKTFVEKFLYTERREPISKFYTAEMQKEIEIFVTELFSVFFESIFSSLFRIIKSMDMKQFACAFIIKRIYLKMGESLTNFGYYLIKVIAKVGGIRSQ